MTNSNNTNLFFNVHVVCKDTPDKDTILALLDTILGDIDTMLRDKLEYPTAGAVKITVRREWADEEDLEKSI